MLVHIDPWTGMHCQAYCAGTALAQSFTKALHQIKASQLQPNSLTLVASLTPVVLSEHATFSTCSMIDTCNTWCIAGIQKVYGRVRVPGTLLGLSRNCLSAKLCMNASQPQPASLKLAYTGSSTLKHVVLPMSCNNLPAKLCIIANLSLLACAQWLMSYQTLPST